MVIWVDAISAAPRSVFIHAVWMSEDENSASFRVLGLIDRAVGQEKP